MQKKMKFMMIGLCLLIGMMFGGSIRVFAQTTIRITNGEWEPYLSEYSYKHGLASHIVSEAFNTEGITVTWGFFPWIRAYKEAQDGEEWDASAVWWPTDETKESFFVSEPVVKTSFVFFHLKSRQFSWESVDDLKGLTIGTTRGYDYGKEFMDAVKEGKIVVDEVATDEQNFKKLLAGRIDIFPNDQIVGYTQIRNNFSSEEVQLFTHYPKEFEQNTLNLIISKNCQNGRLLLGKFNSGLRLLMENGKIDHMYQDLDAGKYDKQQSKWHE